MGLFAQILRLFSRVSGKDTNTKEQMVCLFCGSILRPENHSVQVKPRMKTSKKIQRLQRREQENKPLGKYQQNLLDTYEKGTSSLVVRCNTCGREDTTPCGARRQRKASLSQKGTPRNEKATSSITPKLTGKMLKRLKKREKRREKYSRDSGIAESMSTTTGGKSLSLSSISSVGSALDTSLSSISSKHLSTLPSPFTSTPKAEQRSQKHMSSTYKSMTASSSLFSLTSMKSPDAKSNNSTKSKKGKKNKNKGQSVLQRMLSQQSDQERSKGNSLHQFLSAL